MTKLIPIEALRSGTTIWRKDNGDFHGGQFAEVQSIEDMGADEGFWVSVIIDGWTEAVGFAVMSGDGVEFGGVGDVPGQAPKRLPAKLETLPATQTQAA